MDTFQSLLQAVLQFEPNAEKVLGDFVEETGRDREQFDSIMAELLVLVHQTSTYINNKPILLYPVLKDFVILWSISQARIEASQFPELGKLPILLIGSLFINNLAEEINNHIDNNLLPEESGIFLTMDYWERLVIFSHLDMLTKFVLSYELNTLQSDLSEQVCILHHCARSVLKK